MLQSFKKQLIQVKRERKLIVRSSSMKHRPTKINPESVTPEH